MVPHYNHIRNNQSTVFLWDNLSLAALDVLTHDMAIETLRFAVLQRVRATASTADSVCHVAVIPRYWSQAERFYAIHISRDHVLASVTVALKNRPPECFHSLTFETNFWCGGVNNQAALLVFTAIFSPS